MNVYLSLLHCSVKRLDQCPLWPFASSTSRAESVNSLHLQRYPVKDMKAVIHGSVSTPPLLHPGTKVSNAQEAAAAKSA